MARKKGQAALEFLTTYGWAFLVIIVMIGALAYFGVLSPERFISERCNLGVEWQCSKDTSTLDAAAGDLSVRVTYMGTSRLGVTLTDFSFTSDKVTCSIGPVAYALNQKESVDVNISTTCTGATSGDKLNGEVVLGFYVDSDFEKTQSGELVISAS